MGARKQRQLLATGMRAPHFELPELSGTARSLNQILAGGPVVLAFYKITCPVCQFTLPFLERMHQRGNGVQFVGISQDDASGTRDFQQEFRISFPSLLDEERNGYVVSNAYGISHVPTLYLVEPDGKIGWVLDGFSKRELEALGRRAGVSLFQPGEYVPEWKAG